MWGMLEDPSFRIAMGSCSVWCYGVMVYGVMVSCCHTCVDVSKVAIISLK